MSLMSDAASPLPPLRSEYTTSLHFPFFGSTEVSVILISRSVALVTVRGSGVERGKAVFEKTSTVDFVCSEAGSYSVSLPSWMRGVGIRVGRVRYDPLRDEATATVGLSGAHKTITLSRKE